jgi:hypothetical protein
LGKLSGEKRVIGGHAAHASVDCSVQCSANINRDG